MTQPLPLRRPALDIGSTLPEALLAEFAAASSRRDAERALPYEAVEQLKQSRFGAIRLPVELGGAGATLEESVGAILQLAIADSNIAHIWRNHFMLVERLTLHGVTNPVLRQLRDDVANGALIGLAGAEAVRTQAGGSIASGSKVVADGEGYRFSARKVYSTGSIFADWIVTYGELEDGTRVNIVVPRSREGITLIDDWDGMGQRLTGTGTTIFDNVAIAANEIVHPSDLKPHLNFMSSTIAQLVLTTVISGIAAAIARDATAVLRNRDRTFYYAPTELAKEDPILLTLLGQLEAEAFGVEAIVLSAARYLDRAALAIDGAEDALPAVEASALAAAKAKVVVDALAQRAGGALFDVAGASATLRSLNLDRHWRNLRTVASHNPASYKAFVVGNHVLNGVPVPAQGLF
ncbi:acyl-CoA dehydrogenase [Devosia sp. 2618]|uniref:acyl-CoA dehydrogenase n=1 Tax=Devosia sp. 2618 TaxID=3156454 RepID=UPI00339458B5